MLLPQRRLCGRRRHVQRGPARPGGQDAEGRRRGPGPAPGGARAQPAEDRYHPCGYAAGRGCPWVFLRLVPYFRRALLSTHLTQDRRCVREGVLPSPPDACFLPGAGGTVLALEGMAVWQWGGWGRRRAQCRRRGAWGAGGVLEEVTGTRGWGPGVGAGGLGV